MDFTPRAIDKAEKKLKPFFPKLMVMNGPLIILDVPRPFDLVLDLSYFNGLYREGRLRYASAVAYWLRPGGRFLLYAWQPVSSKDTRGMAKEEVLQCFETGFRLIRCEQGSGLPSAWYYFERVREGKRKDVHKRRRSSIHTADPRTR